MTSLRLKLEISLDPVGPLIGSESVLLCRRLWVAMIILSSTGTPTVKRLLWTEQGDPLQGLTGRGEREEWIFPQHWKDGKEHTFYIEMACNTMLGNPPADDMIQPPQPDKYFQLEKADIVAVNLDARRLYFDFLIIRGL